MKKVKWIVAMAGVVAMMTLACAAGEATQAQSCSEAVTAEGIMGRSATGWGSRGSHSSWFWIRMA